MYRASSVFSSVLELRGGSGLLQLHHTDYLAYSLLFKKLAPACLAHLELQFIFLYPGLLGCFVFLPLSLTTLSNSSDSWHCHPSILTSQSYISTKKGGTSWDPNHLGSLNPTEGVSSFLRVPNSTHEFIVLLRVGKRSIQEF